ncbi:uncharacterized protein [Dysidea avara]|uniref:uncharacterized protein n=1 Tax=Dysidea avara TaxID=196820 RepID=UPI00333102F2
MSVCFQLTLAAGHNDIAGKVSSLYHCQCLYIITCRFTGKIYRLQLTRIFMIQYKLCVFDFINFPRPHGCLNVTENIEFKQHPVPQEISEQVDKQNDELQFTLPMLLVWQNCFYNFVGNCV